MKLDNDIHEIKKREIQPSLNSWDKLSARLNEDEQKQLRWLYWLSGAAAVVLLGFFMFPMITTNVNQSGEQLVIEQESIDVIETNLIKEVVSTTDNAPEVEQIKDVVKATPNRDVMSANKKKSRSLVNHKSLVQKESVEKRSPSRPVKDVGLVNNEIKESKVIPTKQDLMVKENTNEMVSNASLSPSQEADLLLQQALQNQIQPVMAVSRSVDPTLLLLETEWDIESDKRSSLQNSLQQGLNILKAEAVALIEN
jgi:hypothetical protein